MKKLALIFSLSVILLGSNIAFASDDFEEHSKGHHKFGISKKETATLDTNSDGLTDFYAKGSFNGTSHHAFRVNYKIQDCLAHGSTFSDATMKLGFTNANYPSYTWYTVGFKAWNNWFQSAKNPDPSKQITLISEGTTGTPGLPFPTSGNNVFQQSLNGNSGSFTHSNSVKELGGQSGWEGTILFTAPPGSYLIWTVFPAHGGPGCDAYAGLGLTINVSDYSSHEHDDD